MARVANPTKSKSIVFETNGKLRETLQNKNNILINFIFHLFFFASFIFDFIKIAENVKFDVANSIIYAYNFFRKRQN
jgi:hypothetical protein